MKKLLFLSIGFLLVALTVVTANPAPLLFPLLRMPQAYTVLNLSAVDVSAITTYAAANQLPLISSMINGLDISNDVMVMPGVKNEIPMPKLKVGPGFRPYSVSDQYKSKDAAYTDRKLAVKAGKRELMIDPEDYMTTYLAWATSPGSGAGKKDIPFAQYLWQQVIAETQREINDETAYFGFDASAITAYSGAATYSAGDIKLFASATNNPLGVSDYWLCLATTSAGESPDTTPAKWQYVTARAVAPGLKSYIDAGITATTISPVTTGAITATAGVAITAFKKLFRAFNSAYKNNGIIISASYTDFEFLLDDLSDKYKAVKDNVQANGFLVLPDTQNKCIVKPATWLGTSRRLIAGPVASGQPRHANLWMGTDLLADISEVGINTESKMWGILAGIKARIGWQIQDLEGLKVGDQA